MLGDLPRKEKVSAFWTNNVTIGIIWAVAKNRKTMYPYVNRDEILHTKSDFDNRPYKNWVDIAKREGGYETVFVPLPENPLLHTILSASHS